MTLRLGTDDPSKYYIGVDEVDKLYYGTDLVWEPESTSTGFTHMFTGTAATNTGQVTVSGTSAPSIPDTFVVGEYNGTMGSVDVRNTVMWTRMGSDAALATGSIMTVTVTNTTRNVSVVLNSQSPSTPTGFWWGMRNATSGTLSAFVSATQAGDSVTVLFNVTAGSALPVQLAQPDITIVSGETVDVALNDAILGKAPYTYTVSGLPSGVTYASSSHKLAGTGPKGRSTHTVTVVVTDADNKKATATFTLTVRLKYDVGFTHTWTTTATKPSATQVGGTGTGAAMPLRYVTASSVTGLASIDLRNTGSVFINTGATASLVTGRQIYVTVRNNDRSTAGSVTFNTIVTTPSSRYTNTFWFQLSTQLGNAATFVSNTQVGDSITVTIGCIDSTDFYATHVDPQLRLDAGGPGGVADNVFWANVGGTGSDLIPNTYLIGENTQTLFNGELRILRDGTDSVLIAMGSGCSLPSGGLMTVIVENTTRGIYIIYDSTPPSTVRSDRFSWEFFNLVDGNPQSFYTTTQAGDAAKISYIFKRGS